jgi:hypothetical protein
MDLLDDVHQKFVLHHRHVGDQLGSSQHLEQSVSRLSIEQRQLFQVFLMSVHRFLLHQLLQYN